MSVHKLTRWIIAAALISPAALTGCGDDGETPAGDAGADTGVDVSGDVEPDGAPDVEGDTPDASDIGGEDTDAGGEDADVGDDTDAGGTDADTGGDADAGVSPPMITDVELVQNPASTLSAWVTIRTDEPAHGRVEATAPDGTVRNFAFDGDDVEHEVGVWGLRPETTYALRIIVSNSAGGDIEESTLTSGSLPEDFPPIEVVTAPDSPSADDVTLFPVFRWIPDVGRDAEWGYLIAVDGAGVPVWYHRTNEPPEDVRFLADGTVRFTHSNTTIEIVDAMNQLVQRWVATAFTGADDVPAGAITIDIDTVHHEVVDGPDDTWLILSSEQRTVTQAECPDTYDQDYEVIGDVIAQVDPASGEVLRTVSMFDVLDPCRRIDRGFETGFWETFYGPADPTTRDWTHGNAVIWDAANELVISSLRHSDYVVALTWPADGASEIAWILGEDAESNGLQLAGEGAQWQYHQHAPMITSTGSLLLFDNGNLRPGTDFDADDAEGTADLPYSRAVEFVIDTSDADPGAWTATQVWESREVWFNDGTNDVSFYAPFVGDADQVGDHVLVTYGGLADPVSDAIGAPDVLKWARIAEVTHDASGDVVWEIRLRDDAETSAIGYTVYRADRSDVLFP